MKHHNSFRLLILALFLLAPALTEAKRPREVKIHLYPGYCTDTQCFVSGRIVTASRWISRAKKRKSRWRSLFATVRRFTRKTIAFASLKLDFPHTSKTVLTDQKGYFQTSLPAPPLSHHVKRPAKAPHTKASTRPTSRPSTRATSQPSTQPQRPSLWPPWKQKPPQREGLIPFRATLLHTQSRRLRAKVTQGILVTPPAPKGLIVISDLDDTLIRTYVTKKTKLIYGAVFRNAAQVPIIPGALTFLRTLLRRGHRRHGTLHYVTGSPVQLYDRITHLFRLHRFPVGGLNMKYLTGSRAKGLFQQTNYKLNLIRPLLRHFPKHRFVLLGDSGEKDAHVYATIRNEFPKQVAGIFIHLVTPRPPRLPNMQGIFFFRDYRKALAHARKLRLLQ